MTENINEKLVPEKKDCCGCTACMSVCPAGAISMKEDEEGFSYPFADSEKCIGCGKCLSVCTFKNGGKKGDHPETYYVKHRSEDTRALSRSGGMFSALSDIILEDGGVLYGSVLDENFGAVHVRTEDEKGRNLMRGSKYVQSNMGNVIKQAAEDLAGGRRVFFTGTPCQVAAVKAAVPGTENLYTVDIVCHGVPSPKVWRTFLEWSSRKHGKCTAADFRNKKDFGWADHVETLTFEKNGREKKVSTRIFTKLFYSHKILRPACFACPYRSVERIGDISLADAWEVDKNLPEFNDNKGVSLVLVNTDKGQELFDRAKDSIICHETKIEKNMRQSFTAPFPEPAGRKKFWKDFLSLDFEKVAKLHGGYGMKNAIRKKLIAIRNTILHKA